MGKLKTTTLSYHNQKYTVAFIPNVFENRDGSIVIGSESLNRALYDSRMGYRDKSARVLDEQIYAYLDDELFMLPYNDFIKIAMSYLD